MIRKLNASYCQVLHRKTSHLAMIEAIEDTGRLDAANILGVLLGHEVLSMSDMEVLLPTDPLEIEEIKHPKLALLILIAGEFSYYDGAYRRRTHHSANGREAYDKVLASIDEYLIKLGTPN